MKKNFTRCLGMAVISLAGAIAVHSNASRTSADAPEKDSDTQIWRDKLYEKDVQYEKFACDEADAKIIGAYFESHPLKSFLPICHNNCPIVACRPVVPFPLAARNARVTGSVSVHVLVDAGGKVLYARILAGNSLLWAAARRGACDTRFREIPEGKHQGVMHFTVDGYEFLSVPNTANQVW